MRKLPHEHPEVYKHFQEGKFVVKTNAGYVKTVAADMKLEQSIQRSKKRLWRNNRANEASDVCH